MPFQTNNYPIKGTLARLRIGSDTTTLDLMGIGAGYHVQSWRPQVAQPKGGGVFQSSPLSAGRKPVSFQYDNVIETMVLVVNDLDQDDVALWLQRLTTFLQAAQAYWTNNWNAPIERVNPLMYPNSPVYLEARSVRETYSRYAAIYSWSIPELSDPYGAAFNINNGAVLDELTLIIERGQWQDVKPAYATALEIGAYSEFDGRTVGDVDNTGAWMPTTAGVPVGNSYKTAGLTHVFNYDDSAGTFSANALDAALPYFLLPILPAVGDAVYYGIDKTVTNAGPFTSIVHSIDIPGDGYTLEWQYWDGATWATLDVMDNTDGYTTTGRVTVHWRQPTDWTENVVNLIDGFWVRAIVTAIPGPLANARQNTYTIYTLNYAFVEIRAAQSPGEMSQLMTLTLTDLSDRDAPDGGSEPDLWANRVIIGARSMSRDSSVASPFNAFLNISDDQQYATSGTTLGTNTTFAASAYSQTGRCAVYNPTADNEAVATRVTVTIPPALGASYFGTYRLFVRGQQTAGSAGEIVMQMSVTLGLGYEIYRSTTRTFPVTGGNNLIEFGSITIPPDQYQDMLFGSLMQCQFKFNLMVGSSGTGSAAALAEFYDVVLIPTDEWSCDLIDTVADDTSLLGRVGSVHGNLVADSARYPRGIIRTMTDYGGFTGGIWRVVAAAPAQLQCNVDQRLWCLTARRYDTSYAEDDWRSNHEYAMSVQIDGVARYLTLRGGSVRV